MIHLRIVFVSIFFLYCSIVVCKIVLPHKLRYLENMLNSEVMAKAEKIRQRIEANPNTLDGDKGWPMLLAKYQNDKRNLPAFNNPYSRRHYK